MSLNHKEIDLILSELDIEESQIQRIIQPSFDTLILGLYKSGRETDLLLSVAPGGCRIHSLSRKVPKPERPLRFMECLRSRIRGGRIEAVRQIGTERVIRFDIRSHTENLEKPGEYIPFSYRLYARLWSGAGNIVLAETNSGKIIDVMSRRPGKGEVSGESCMIEENLAEAAARPGMPARQIFAVRDLPGEGGFNARVEAFYNASGTELSRDKLLALANERYIKKKTILEERIAELERRVADFSRADRYRELGDILMGAIGTESVTTASGQYRDIGANTSRVRGIIDLADFYRGGRVSISIDSRLDLAENARDYYVRYKKAVSGLSEVQRELDSARDSLREAGANLASLESEPEVFRIARALVRAGTARTSPKREYPGLSLEVSGWTMLVGRSAKENDELLRRHVRGSDTWLHARDFAGSYVFIKSRPGKSIPLDILLDAGSLALYYSKGRAQGRGDLYYTQVKYLRRAKDGPKGLVIPTQEKNLFVKIGENRMQVLRSLMGSGE